ncbi:MAG: glycosyltransferase [Chloroflexi bacterium]|nr:glycosyltransferase [Chloroflexota bacterium]MCI0579122.1 glycosyltransferase [Chloroflexota bacterium]MCI0643339.1 glycosyltransferase [Chloroflexota bacterium]MCI0728318.1 glycosyltransferase [Chloroflexota bacterium]
MLDPTLSVVVAAQEARLTIAACLDSLLGQNQVAGLQIIVADGSRDGTADFVASHYPAVTLVRRPYPCSLPHLLGAGLALAQGQIVAITEGHCRFPPEWAEAVLRAHQATDGPVIGGAVEPGEGLRLTAWALYFADYGQFMRPLPAGPAREMPGENVSFKRPVLAAAGKDFATEGFWKTFFCWSLEQAGHPLLAEPAIAVTYHRHIGLGQMVRRRLRHGRCFGGMRARDLSPGRRLLLAAAGPLLPLLLAWRLWRNVWPKRRYRRQFLLAFPLAYLAILAWSAGEWWGNLIGPGRSCQYV